MSGAGVCWSILWFFLILIIALPVAVFCAGFYLLFSPFSACIEACTPLVELLEKGLKLPLQFALNLVHQKSIC